MTTRSVEVTYTYNTNENGVTHFAFQGGHKHPVMDRNNNLERWALINEVIKAEIHTGWPMSSSWVSVLEDDIETARESVAQMRKEFRLP